ncbi:VOC family protein [Desemzia sp. RIT804]|uniref:VOC family protein n=1 Tax=Desemzia sp. RIT 804 TaxID=2810209 RepID=UPI00194FBF90|nr:VOC family protein [Desemzia sp. RIT 804]MBM6614837.1 VOC family protein [Desemzia sp. RIT 804]
MNHSIIHHVSVINRDIEKSFQFYHNILGLDLLLKTVNQDDIEMYHLFFSDTTGRPGTEFTIFQMTSGADKTFGTNSIERTIFAVPSVAALNFWEKRLNEYGLFNCEIEDYNNSKILRFEDYDGVQLGLVPLKNADNLTDYSGRVTTDISLENAIVGIDSVHLRVRYSLATTTILQQFFDLSLTKTIHHGDLTATVLSKEDSFLDQEIHVIEDKKNPLEVLGIGGTHHIALSVSNNTELKEVEELVVDKNFMNSGIKNREFFYSLYFREPNNILIEVATEEVALDKASQESFEGVEFDAVPLALPNFLEPRRAFIESNLFK